MYVYVYTLCILTYVYTKLYFFVETKSVIWSISTSVYLLFLPSRVLTVYNRVCNYLLFSVFSSLYFHLIFEVIRSLLYLSYSPLKTSLLITLKKAYLHYGSFFSETFLFWSVTYETIPLPILKKPHVIVNDFIFSI